MQPYKEALQRATTWGVPLASRILNSVLENEVNGDVGCMSLSPLCPNQNTKENVPVHEAPVMQQLPATLLPLWHPERGQRLSQDAGRRKTEQTERS